jgi:hypothetical protein
MEFQFDLVWRASLTDPAALAEGIAGDPIAVFNRADHEEQTVIENVYRM